MRLSLREYNNLVRRAFDKVLDREEELIISQKVVDWLNDDDILLTEQEAKQLMTQLIDIELRYLRGQ